MSPRHALLFLACLVCVSPPGALSAANQPVRLDTHGDPLPPGVLLRLGTARLRACARFLAFTPDGRTLVTGEYVQNCVVRFWDAATVIEKANFQLTGHQFPFALSPNGKTLAVDATQQSQAIVFLSAPDGKEIGRIAGLHGEQGANLYFSRLDFSPDGKTLAAVGNDSVVRLFDVATGKTILHLTGEAGGRFPTAFSPDGKTLALVGPDNTLRLVEIAAKKEILKRQVPRKAASRALNMSFSPDGEKLAWAGEDQRTFALWDIAAGKPVLQFRGPSETVASVHFSPDGKRIAAAYTGEDGGSIRLWDAESGKELRKFASPNRATDDLAFSPDGKRLAGGEDRDGVVHLWDVETGKELSRVGEHQGFVCSVAFSPDGRTAFTGCADRIVREWDADKGTVARRIDVGGDGGDPFSSTVALA